MRKLASIFIGLFLILACWKCFPEKKTKCYAPETNTAACEPMGKDTSKYCLSKDSSYFECKSLVIRYPEFWLNKKDNMDRPASEGNRHLFQVTEAILKRDRDNLENFYDIPKKDRGVDFRPCPCGPNIFIYENDSLPFDIETKTQEANGTGVIADGGGAIELNYIFEIEANIPKGITQYVNLNPSPCCEPENEVPNFESNIELLVNIHHYINNSSSFSYSCDRPFTTDTTRKILAILDTGVHPGFIEDNVLYAGPQNTSDCLNNEDVFGWNFVSDDADVGDDNGHGTIVTKSYLHGLDKLSPDITFDQRVLPIKVLDSCGRGTLFDIICGLHYAINKKAEVINMSLGANIKESKSFSIAMERAHNEGIVTVTSAGNEGDPLEPNFISSRIDHYPSAYCQKPGHNKVFEVGAACLPPSNLAGPTNSNQYAMWNHSNYRKGMFIEAGINYQELFTGYFPQSYIDTIAIHGTSMATPIASSAVMFEKLVNSTDVDIQLYQNDNCQPIIGFHSYFR